MIFILPGSIISNSGLGIISCGFSIFGFLTVLSCSGFFEGAGVGSGVGSCAGAGSGSGSCTGAGAGAGAGAGCASSTSSNDSDFTSFIPNLFKIAVLFIGIFRLSTISMAIFTGLANCGYLIIIVFFFTGSFFSLNKSDI